MGRLQGRLVMTGVLGVTVLAGALGPALPASTIAVTQAGVTPPARPNVLVVLTDDQRADSMAMMPKTRRWLQDGGTRFSEAYATIPICAPMRSSVMSGRYQHNHGVVTNLDAPERLDQSATIQKYLHDGGYQTGLDGKFLIGWPIATPPPNFDHFAHFLGGYENVRWNVDGKVLSTHQYVTDFQSDRAIDFLRRFEQDPARPWYLYLTPEAPHLPSTPAPRYSHAPVPPWQPTPPVTQTDRSDKPDFIRRQSYSRDQAEKTRSQQLRTLLSVDDMMDRVLGHLQQSGQLDNTVVIYAGDSGWLYSEYGLHSKSVPYTPSIHVPFYLRWPGHVAAGATDRRPIELVDIASTVLDAAGVRPQLKYPMDGRSVLGHDVRRENLLEYHYSPDFTSTPSWASIRSPTYQYIEWYHDEAGSSLWVREYYDLVHDPWELDNLLGDRDPGNDPPASLLADLSARLAHDRTCQGTSGASSCP